MKDCVKSNLLCLPCELASGQKRIAKMHRLKYPLSESTPIAMRWEPPGPPLFMCDSCAEKAKDWAEEGEP